MLSPARSWISVPSNSGRRGRGKSSTLRYPPCWIFLVCGSQLMWAFLLWLYKINLGGFSHLRRLSSSVSGCRRAHLAWCLSSVLSTLLLSLLSGLAWPSCLHLLVLALVSYELYFWSCLELFHIISVKNEFLLLMVCPLSVGWWWSLSSFQSLFDWVKDH